MRLLFISVLLLACSPLPRDFQKEEQIAPLLSRALSLMRSYDESGGRSKLESARAALELAREVHPQDARVFDAIGCVEWRRGYFKEAKHYFGKALAINPEYGRAYGNLALIAERDGNHEAAKELLQLAVSLDPSDYRSRNNLGVAFLRSEEEALARAEFLKALHSVRHKPKVVLENLR